MHVPAQGVDGAKRALHSASVRVHMTTLLHQREGFTLFAAIPLALGQSQMYVGALDSNRKVVNLVQEVHWCGV